MEVKRKISTNNFFEYNETYVLKGSKKFNYILINRYKSFAKQVKKHIS